MSHEPLALELANVVKDYKGLRPLRIRSLSVARGERISLSGFDRPGAEALVNLLTGAALPDEGEIRVLGRPTSTISSGDDWLASLDRFGIVTERAAMLDGLTLAQNLTLSFTLAIDSIPDEITAKVEALGAEVGLDSASLGRRPSESAPADRLRVHLARAVASDPAILLLEHPTASLPADAVSAVGRDAARVARARGVTLVAITEDEAFAREIADRRLKLTGATGELAPVKRFYFF